MKDIQKHIDEYSRALQSHIEAVQSEVEARVTVRKTHFQLLTARQALKAIEEEALELKNNNENII
jgi:hypothetical protein